MNQTRTNQGQYGKNKTHWIRNTFITLCVVAVGAAAYMEYTVVNPALEVKNPVINLMPQKAEAAETTDAKIDRLKTKVLDDMVACENPGHLLVWQDDNASGTLPRKDKVSSGDLAYKISTIQRHYKTLHQKELSDKEALNLALDSKQARELAINSWLNIKGSINEWTCATEQMKTRIEDIRIMLDIK